MKSVTRGTARGMTRKQTGLTLVAATVLGTAMVSWAMPSATSIPQVTPSPSHTIQEDEPGWDCHTMGNRICGSDAGIAEDTAGTHAPAWMVEAADGPDTPRNARIASAYEFVSQERGTWRALTSEEVDVMTEGMGPVDEVWEACVIAVGDTSWVVCEDGTVVES